MVAEMFVTFVRKLLVLALAIAVSMGTVRASDPAVAALDNMSNFGSVVEVEIEGPHLAAAPIVGGRDLCRTEHSASAAFTTALISTSPATSRELSPHFADSPASLATLLSLSIRLQV